MAITETRFSINGVIDTNNNVIQNMENIANQCSSWISYDMFVGKWAVVINKAEPVSQVFTDDEIVGSINLNGTGLGEMYNAVEVSFPSADLNYQNDYVRLEIPTEDRFPNEADNTLSIDYNLTNDPVQAQLLGLLELKQSRLDKTITFKCDYSYTSLEAGAVIAITSSLYGWTEKKFRIITIKEINSEDALLSEITALEYYDSVYDASDLERYARPRNSGIRSIGAIGIPNAPNVAYYDTGRRPHITVGAQVPEGLVNGMEYWISYDDEEPSDELRYYQLIDYFAGTAGNNLVEGETVTIDYDKLDEGSFYVKVRGYNDDVTGPYSDPTPIIFAPTQVTDAISANTEMVDSGGIPLGSLLSLLLPFIQSNGAFPVIAAAGKTTVNNLAELGYLQTAQMYLLYFTPSTSGLYQINCIIDQNASGANGGRGNNGFVNEPVDNVAVGFALRQGAQLLAGSASGGTGAFGWTDFVLTNLYVLTAGVEYSLQFYYYNYTESSPGTTASFDISWNVNTVEIY